MITGRTNPRVKKVREYTCKKKARDEDKVFVAEGLRLVREAPQEDILDLYVSASYEKTQSKADADFLKAFAEKKETVSDEIFSSMTDTKTPQGILAVVRQKILTPADSLSAPSGCVPLVTVLEDIRDPGNLGTIMRSSEAAGASCLILCGECADIYSPKVVRSTMGSIFRLPFAYVSDIKKACALLKEKGITTACADMNGEKKYYDFDSSIPTAFIIGNEANGLSADARKLCDVTLSIPMAGRVESLNAAVSASILLFDAAAKRATAHCL